MKHKLGKQSIRRIVNLFSIDKVGCVSGEKRIINKESDMAAGARRRNLLEI
jgi:hypothetical protein